MDSLQGRTDRPHAAPPDLAPVNDLARRHREAQLQVVVDTVREVIFQMDLEGRWEFLNPAWTHSLGHGVAESLGRSFMEFVAPEDQGWLSARFQELKARSGPRQPAEVRCLTVDGGIRWLEAYARPLRDPDGTLIGFAGTLNDITERKRSESALLQAQKLESLGVLAGGIAHDFNNLLVAILGNAELAEHHLCDPVRARRHLGHVKSASVKAGDLCRQLLAYSGKGRFVVEPLDLNHLVRDMTDLLHVSIHKGATLAAELAEPLPRIEADATQLRQALMNLVINASDAIAPHTGTIRIRTGHGPLPEGHLDHPHLSHDLPAGEVVWLQVEDTGCGMDEETLCRIFDPFFTTKFTGRGLGLAAILGIVRSHRGALQVASRPGEGTLFTLCFPQAGGRGTANAGTEAESGNYRLKGTVLVADDEDGVRALLQDALSDLGLTVLQAHHGQEALTLFDVWKDTLDLVLLDLTMPVMGGEEVYHHLRHGAPHLPVILMSGFSEQESMGVLNGDGLAGFLQKPFPLGDLRGLVRRVLAKQA